MDDRPYADYVKKLVAGAPPVSPEVLARIRDLMPPVPPARWSCPNEPPCPHPAVLHDVADVDDRAPRCCADECTCPAPMRSEEQH